MEGSHRNGSGYRETGIIVEISCHAKLKVDLLALASALKLFN